jgi:hypothetical protein
MRARVNEGEKNVTATKFVYLRLFSFFLRFWELENNILFSSFI